MPDKIGAFLEATKIITEFNLNISRVSYNKAIDTHMLFIEVDGDEESLKKAEAKLNKAGYLKGDEISGKVILLEFYLPDTPGALYPVLELINEYNFNISYISSNSNNKNYQNFKMGLFVTDKEKYSRFIDKAKKICSVKEIDYESSAKVLDNTVFYVSFVNEISEKIGCTDYEKRELLINSNLIMQRLDEMNLPPYKTFDYIGKFCDYIHSYKGENYKPRISDFNIDEKIKLIVVEPPCGSNTCVFVMKDKLLFIDSGFNCYKKELFDTLEEIIPDFSDYKKEIILTHSDVDHIGFLDSFSKVFLSENTAINLSNVSSGKKGYREEIPAHAPYVKISKILSEYEFPSCKNFSIIGRKYDDSLLSYIGNVKSGELNFYAYEGMGGHVKGETVFIEKDKRLVFTGDIFINIKDVIKEQAEFNKLAPYLLSSVDTNPEIAGKVRREIKPLLENGKWTVIGGHGAPVIWDV